MQANLNSLELLDGQPAIADPAKDLVARILLSERDDILCQSCLSALAKASKDQCVVAVVGESHLAGMSASLQGNASNVAEQRNGVSQQDESAHWSMGSRHGEQQEKSHLLDTASADQSRHQPFHQYQIQD